MDLQFLFDFAAGPWWEDLLVWTAALMAGLLGLVALINAVDMVLGDGTE